MLIFPSNAFIEDTWNYFLKNKPASKSYSGTYIPILVDLANHKLAYFSIGTNPVSQPTIVSSLPDQLELLFQIPLNDNKEIDIKLERFINKLRQPEGVNKEDLSGALGTMTLGELKTLSNQFLFQGLMKTSDLYPLHLLYHSYLAEFFITLESIKDMNLPSNLSLESLLSLENFFTNIAENIEAGFMKGFNESFNFGESNE